MAILALNENEDGFLKDSAFWRPYLQTAKLKKKTKGRNCYKPGSNPDEIMNLLGTKKSGWQLHLRSSMTLLYNKNKNVCRPSSTIDIYMDVPFLTTIPPKRPVIFVIQISRSKYKASNTQRILIMRSHFRL